MRIDRVLADGEDGQVWEVDRIQHEVTTNPLAGPRRTLDAGYEYCLASGEELETVDAAKGQYRTWDGGVLITLRTSG